MHLRYNYNTAVWLIDIVFGPYYNAFTIKLHYHRQNCTVGSSREYVKIT